jgi:hypothetical protein
VVKHLPTTHGRNSRVGLDTADSRSEADELCDSFVLFWLSVQRNYSNYGGADELVQVVLTMLARLCSLPLRFIQMFSRDKCLVCFGFWRILVSKKFKQH